MIALSPSHRSPSPSCAAVGLVVAAPARPSTGALGTPATPAAPPREPTRRTMPRRRGRRARRPAPSVAPSLSPALPAARRPPGAPATPRPVAGTTTVRAYFMLGSFTGNAGLVPVLREVPRTKAVARAAMTALLAGPEGRRAGGPPGDVHEHPGRHASPRHLDRGRGRDRPPVARVRGRRRQRSMAGRARPGRLHADPVPHRGQVRFQVDGEPVRRSAPRACPRPPVGRADYDDQSCRPSSSTARPGAPPPATRCASAASPTSSRPSSGSRSSTPTGTVLADEPVMATCGTGCWGTFKADVPYTVAKAQYGTLRVFDPRPRTGRRRTSPSTGSG